jgi:hypothetical protein
LVDAPRNDDEQAGGFQVLLELEILVAGDQDFEACGEGLAEERTVLQARPALLLSRSNVVADEVRRELARQLFIEKNAHA